MDVCIFTFMKKCIVFIGVLCGICLSVFAESRNSWSTAGFYGLEVYLLAEGLIDGKVVVSEMKRPARRPAKIVMWVDDEGEKLVADGSDFVTVIAAITDQ